MGHGSIDGAGPTDRQRAMLTAQATGLPSVSAVLLTYDCEAYVAAAVDGVLAQDYAGRLEVIVSDDASRDSSFAIAQARAARYRGPHRVVLMRQPVNTGSKSAHLNEAFPACTGELLVSFDGDDVSMPTRVTRIVDRFLANPGAHAVFSSYALLDDSGGSPRPARVPRPPQAGDPAAWFARVDAYAPGATLAVRRGVVEAFGALDSRLNEDIQLPFRAGLLGDVEFIAEPLVHVRRHAGSFTADWNRYSSLARYRERMLAGIQNAARARECRLADLQKVAQLRPHERDRWTRLRGMVDRSLYEAELTRALVSERARERLGGLAALVREGAYPDQLVQHALLALVPRLYLRYRRLRLGLGSGVSARAPQGEDA